MKGLLKFAFESVIVIALIFIVMKFCFGPKDFHCYEICYRTGQGTTVRTVMWLNDKGLEAQKQEFESGKYLDSDITVLPGRRTSAECLSPQDTYHKRMME